MKIPFNVQIAKQIQNHDIIGQVLTNYGDTARIICTDMNNDKYPIVAIICNHKTNKENVEIYDINGINEKKSKLILDVPICATFKEHDLIYAQDKKTSAKKIYSVYQITIDKWDMSLLAYGSYDLTTHEAKLGEYVEDISISTARYATESEKKSFFNAMNKICSQDEIKLLFNKYT